MNSNGNGDEITAMVSQMLGMQDIGGDEHRSTVAIQGSIVGGARTGMQAGLGAALAPKADPNKAKAKADRDERIAKALVVATGMEKTEKNSY